MPITKAPRARARSTVRFVSVDVARRDLDGMDVAVGNRELASVVGQAANAGDRSCVRAVEDDDLSLGCGIAGLEHRLAVEAYVRVALGDEPVRLARNDERARCESDVDGLAAAALREQHLARRGGRLRRDRDRTLERGDRCAERLDEIVAPVETMRDECR